MSLALRFPGDPKPAEPAGDTCGDCAGWRCFQLDNAAGGKCAHPGAPRFNAIITRDTAACSVFSRCGVQLELLGG